MELNFDPENPPYEYITTHEKAITALETIDKAKVIAIDVEANGLDAYVNDLLLVQVGTEETSFIFDARKVVLKDIPLYHKIMEDQKKIKLMQNGKFDYKYIKLQTGAVINNIYDTMLAELVLSSGLGMNVGLKDLVSRYIGDGVIDKELQGSFVDMPKNARISKDQLKYAARDTLILYPIFHKQIAKLKKENLLKIAKLEFRTTTVVAEMELKGIYIDKKKWKGIIKNLQARRDELAAEFQDAIRSYYKVSQEDLFGGMADAININSNMQLMDLFNNKLRLNMPSTGSSELNMVNHPIVKILRDYRGYEKLISSFGESVLNKINKKTGRIHPSFSQMRTATGRFACNNPNIQQIPRNSEEAPFRECINPEPGYKLVVSDYSSFEMRILADLSHDEKMIHALKEGLDIHSYTASLMFDKPYTDDFKKLYPDLRQIAKPIGFGLMYGMGAVGLVSQIRNQTGKEVTQDESEDLINRYFKSYPSVKKFLDNMAADAVKHGWSMTPAGRKRWYKLPEKTDPDFRRKMSSIKRQAKNHPIQGTNADAIKFALVYVQERMEKDKIDGSIILTVHDEIACEVREDQAEAFAEVLSEEMVRAGKLFIKDVPIKSDPFVGDVWEH